PGPVPFDPRRAVTHFAELAKRYRCKSVHGDAYAGQTFRSDFLTHGIDYLVTDRNRTDLYEAFEVALNAGHVELLDLAKMEQQFSTLVLRGASIDHPPGAHDDWSNAAAGAVTLVNPECGTGGGEGWIEYYRRLAAQAGEQETRAGAQPN